MNRIAVCLITRDRVDSTRETLNAWTEQNTGNDPDRRFVLLHADDASESKDNVILASDHGFETVVRHKQPLGVTQTIRDCIGEALRRHIPYVLLLENDWTAIRPFPWDLFDYFTQVSVAYTLRLTGRWKEWNYVDNCGRRAFGNDHAGRNKAPIMWCPLMDAPEPAEMGSIHFGNPPAVTRLDTLLWLLEGCSSEREVREKSGRLVVGQDYTIRPVCDDFENPVFFHIGADRTPHFKR